MNTMITRKPGYAELRALCFLAALIILPTTLTIISFGQGGGIFVIGYLLGALTAPALFIGCVHAMGTLIGPTSFNNVTALVCFTICAVLVVAAIALWSVVQFLGS